MLSRRAEDARRRYPLGGRLGGGGRARRRRRFAPSVHAEHGAAGAAVARGVAAAVVVPVAGVVRGVGEVARGAANTPAAIQAAAEGEWDG